MSHGRSHAPGAGCPLAEFSRQTDWRSPLDLLLPTNPLPTATPQGEKPEPSTGPLDLEAVDGVPGGPPLGDVDHSVRAPASASAAPSVAPSAAGTYPSASSCHEPSRAMVYGE
ncbi:hypothetical protein BCD49_20735 [Pseudofrankia sp. EUN1h]|nr:hypothetical protein BCD49_20735 [Pseudofrankia sp. EUN1h]